MRYENLVVPHKSGSEPYPGDDCTPQEIFALAREFHQAAEDFYEKNRWGVGVNKSPWRMLAMQAVELYLNALLRFQGMTACQVRGMQHNFAQMAKFARLWQLPLRASSFEVLTNFSKRRENVAVRFDAKSRRDLTELNGLRATMLDLAKKVARHTNFKF